MVRTVSTRPSAQADSWEIAIRISLGKYRLNRTFEGFWDNGMRRNDTTALSSEIRHTVLLAHCMAQRRFRTHRCVPKRPIVPAAANYGTRITFS